MLKWVEEEVDRVKAMFEEKEKRLNSELQQAKLDLGAAKAAQTSAAEAQHEAEQQLQSISQQLQVGMLRMHNGFAVAR